MDRELFLGLSHVANPQSQRKALAYFEELKSTENGWRMCAQVISNSDSDEYQRFFCFQVVENYLKHRYIDASSEDQVFMKNFLMSYYHNQHKNDFQDKSFIRNKAAQVFSLAFICDYPLRWSSFFQDILGFLSGGDKAIDLYLRILMAIDAEVVDRELDHAAAIAKRNTDIKDTMRIQCIDQLVDSWFTVITSYEECNAELVCQCLEVIGAYISWIDIALIANQRFVPALMKLMGNYLIRESACDCIHEVILKGMDPMAKRDLIEGFMEVLNNANIFNNTQSDEDDGDFLVKLSKLMNGIGTQLISNWQKVSKSKTQLSENVDNLKAAEILRNSIEAKIPLLFQFLSNEDNDVSSGVSKFAHDYLTVLKVTTVLTEQQKLNAKTMLLIVVKTMKYDNSYNFDIEGEEEAMFQDYRKEMKIIFNNIGALDKELVMSCIYDMLCVNIEKWPSLPYEDLEIVIQLFYNLAEALPSIHGSNYLCETCPFSTKQKEMMKLLVTSNVSHYPHSLIVSQYFETIVRYSRFFNMHPQYLTDVIISFVDKRGLRNPSPQVGSRVSYLFSRFVKDINKLQLSVYVEDLLSQMEELLFLYTPDNGPRNINLSDSDQLFLYETAGMLIAQTDIPINKKQQCMKKILAPLVNNFESLLTCLSNSTDELKKDAYAQSIAHAISCASRTSKGFSTKQTIEASGCVEAYTHTLQIFLSALNAPSHRSLLHTGVKQFLHRMVICLELEVLPFIPMSMEHLIKSADARELQEFIPLLNQVVTKFKIHIVPFLQEVFMPIVKTIFNVLMAPFDDSDQILIVDKRMLQRGYYTFIIAILSNNVSEVLSSQESPNLHQILLTIIHGAVEIPDPVGQKLCFSIFQKIIQTWTSNNVMGFVDFMYDQIIPACFLAPMKQTFDLKDAQTIQVLNECASCLKAAHDARSDELLQFLEHKYLPSLNLSSELIQEFCYALKLDIKSFKPYYKDFFTRAKS